MMKQICDQLNRFRESALIVDYGYEIMPKEGTIDAWSKHGYTDILASPGKVDVTAGVNFSLLKNISVHVAHTACLETQRSFLKPMQIDLRANILSDHAPIADRPNIDRDLFLLTDPTQMGERFKVLDLTAPMIRDSHGFI